MRAYIVVTGIVFLLLAMAHVWRAMVERNLLAQPWFYIATILPAILFVWAMALLRRSS